VASPLFVPCDLTDTAALLENLCGAVRGVVGIEGGVVSG
jgi:hypothetical protein